MEFDPSLHDDGAKEVLGERIPAGLGEGDLDRVLAIVAGHPATARHLGSKLCRRFIGVAEGDDGPEPAAVERVAEAFRSSGGEIRATLSALFETEAFRGAAGRKLKRPFRFLVSALRATGARTDGGGRIHDYLLSMGHAPFQYPTPDGYPDDETPWHGTLLWRWRFAVELAENRLPGTRIDLPGLLADFPGRLHRHLLGRRPTAAEAAGDHGPGKTLALALASPGFQRY